MKGEGGDEREKKEREIRGGSQAWGRKEIRGEGRGKRGIWGWGRGRESRQVWRRKGQRET